MDRQCYYYKVVEATLFFSRQWNNLVFIVPSEVYSYRGRIRVYTSVQGLGCGIHSML